VIIRLRADKMKNIFEEAWVVHGLDGLEWTVVEGSEFMRSL
jgi:hypothetical protein